MFITYRISSQSLHITKRKHRIILVVANSIAQARQLVDHKSSNLQKSRSSSHYLHIRETILGWGNAWVSTKVLNKYNMGFMKLK
jgi:hypothetical protein